MRIRIRTGCTRIVLLVGAIAIKVALPFRPFAPFVVIFNEFINGGLDKKMNKYEGSLVRIALRIVFNGGIDSNRREIRISREHPEYPIAHVLRSYLSGYILVMPRGEALEESWVPKEAAPALSKELLESDFFYPRNSCSFDEKVLFVDYGDPSAEGILQMLSRTECRP